MPAAQIRNRLRGAYRAFRRPVSGSAVRSGRGPIPVPPCPPDHLLGPPDFVGVGVMKAGTSWWYRLLISHPQVCNVVGRPKEVHFFDRFCRSEWREQDLLRYQQFFPRRPPALVGEWTPRYLHDHWVPPLLRRAAPDVRVLVMLRDPIARFVSGLAHELNRSAAFSVTLSNDHFTRGLYAVQLERLYEAFPRRQVLVLQYERCRRDPEQELRRTFAFLGVDDGHQPRAIGQRVNDTWGEKPRLTEPQLDGLRRAYAPDLVRLSAIEPDLDLDLWPTAVGARS